MDETQKDIFLWSRKGKDPKVKFEIVWKKSKKMDNCIKNTILFFSNNEILKTTEFEMSFSLDNLYNLDILRKNYINKYQNQSINFEICQSLFKKLAKSDYFEKGNSVEEFYRRLIKIGLDYDVIYKRDIRSDQLFFRTGEDVLKFKFIEKKLNENLYSNEEVKKNLLIEAQNS